MILKNDIKHAHRGVFIGAGFYFAAVIGYCVYNGSSKSKSNLT